MSEVVEVGAFWPRPWEGPPGGPARLHLEGGVIRRIEPGGPGRGIAMPGFVNAHDHARGIRPLAAGIVDGPLEAWLWRLRGVPAVDPWLNAAVAFGRMARAGIVAVADLHLPRDPLDPSEAEAVRRAARDVGLTVAFVAPIVDRNLQGLDGGAAVRAALGSDAARLVEPLPPVAEQIALVDAVAAQDGPGFVTQYGPAGPHWVSDGGWDLIAERSAATGRRIHTHLLETAPQRRWLDRAHGGRPLDWLARTGLLNDRLIVAHGVHLRRDECEGLAAAGSTLAVNLSSNLRLASGLPPGGAIAASRLRFGLGLDGLPLGDRDDMGAEMRLAATLLGGWGHARRGPDPRAVLRAATAWGWRAIDGRERHGLAEGAPADLVVLDDAILADRLDDEEDPTDLIFGRLGTDAVRDVWARGRGVVRDGRVLGVDLPALEGELLAQARATRPDAAATRLWERAAQAAAEAGRREEEG